ASPPIRHLARGENRVWRCGVLLDDWRGEAGFAATNPGFGQLARPLDVGLDRLGVATGLRRQFIPNYKPVTWPARPLRVSASGNELDTSDYTRPADRQQSRFKLDRTLVVRGSTD